MSHPDTAAVSLQAAAALLIRQRRLIWAMAKREISDRYAGQMLGAVWAIAHPLLVMAVYLFVFGYVFKTRIGGTRELPLDYTTYLLAGLVPWLSIQEALTKAPVSVTSNASLVKQVVFPLEVLPIKGVLASLLPQAVSLTVLVIYVIATFGGLHATYLLLPLVVLIQIGQMCGLSLLLAAIGVYLRDLKDIIQVVLLLGMYLLPIFYLPSMVPVMFRPLLYLNPFSYIVWCYQDVCYFGRIEHPWAWVVASALAVIFFVTGWVVFRRLKPMFGNVL
jgi:lipopolysaccharide transport system permease protein